MALIVEVDGWVQDEKHYVALKTLVRRRAGQRFKVATDAGGPTSRTTRRHDRRHRAAEPPKPAAPNVEEDAKKPPRK